MMQKALVEYLGSVEREFRTGVAAEHAYRPALKQLLEAIEPGLTAVNDPRRSDIGAPDFQVLRHHTTIGFVEAKDIGVDLDKVENSEQMKRYLAGFGNVLLTDYLEFRWYVKGERRQRVRIASADKKRLRTDESQFDDLAHMLRSFAQVIVPTVNTARELAQRMAANAHLIRDLIFNDLESPEPSTNLAGQREAFRKTLLPDIDNAQFADMYAQTIAYGLFAARVNYSGNPAQFSRRGAGEDIPRTNPFLRKLFTNIGIDLGDRVTFLVDVLADLLARTKMDDILKDFGRATRQEDPVVHFYETFLREYDPRLREQRGVYYTPEPVVSYIVRSVDHILRERFGRADGLADKETLILDPATGTGTFLYFVMRQIHESFAGQMGVWSRYVSDHLLRRIFGFELLMAPYAVAHMKLGLLLGELGYSFDSDQRLGVYLTNTLEEARKTSESLFSQFISDEADEASAVKRDKPIMVVLGNPPYSGHSANTGEWIRGLVRDYYFVDGKPLGERNSKWLQNDYVKFIRFGQWRINLTGSGILAFITDNSYLDSVTFRGMRQQLLETFSDIYILNLHGNSNKKERTPDGGIDQNVFDIQQGVAIGIFVKEQGKSGPAHVHHVNLWGMRQEKYNALLTNDLTTSQWKIFEPRQPYFRFSPQDFTLEKEYETGWKVTDIFGTGSPKSDSGTNYSLGIITHNDLLHIGWTKDELEQRIAQLADNSITDSEILARLPVQESRYWKTSRERRKVRESDWKSQILSVYYRPFDWRYIYYEPQLMDIGRGGSSKNVMGRARNSRLNLMVSRGFEIDTFEHVLVSDKVAVHHAATRKEGNYFFPLYLQPKQREGELFGLDDDGSAWPLSDKGRRPNLNPQFVQEMAGKLGLTFITDGQGDLQTTFGPEDIFAYAYAVFHSPTYRERYVEFLKIDFPRLPLTGDLDVFRALAAKGAELVALHLMRDPALNRLLTTYPVGGNNQVEAGHPKYTDEDQRVWINKAQYFEGVPSDVWEFHVGGYQVLEKWLKDRRGRELSYDDIRHYQRVVVALRETIRLMDEIDEAIPAWPLE